jgi:hypothetical protein
MLFMLRIQEDGDLCWWIGCSCFTSLLTYHFDFFNYRLVFYNGETC